MKFKRRYFTECALNIYSSEPGITVPSKLDVVMDSTKDVQNHIKDSNIYFILKRPKANFIPESIKVENGFVSGELCIKQKGPDIKLPFLIKNKLPDKIKVVKSDVYPHNTINLYEENGEIFATYPVFGLLREMKLQENILRNHKVIYIGKAFGKEGERHAVTRLSSHSTLQKILSDVISNEPDMDIVLALYRFEYQRFIVNFGLASESMHTGDFDDQHYMNTLSANFNKKMRVSIAEAALIRYFEPHYNVEFKEGFPHKNQLVLKKVYNYDFASLIVEVSTEEHDIMLYSEKQLAKTHHLAQFDLHREEDRKAFFFGKL